MAEKFTVDSPEALKAVAHPVRQKILMHLISLGHARAADLAQAIDEPANSVSFHLRTLARAGLIAEAPEHARDRRDRVWKPVAASYQVEPDTPGMAGAILNPAVAWLRELFAAAGADPSNDEGPARSLLLSQLLLTQDEAEKFSDELVALYERWSEQASAATREEPDGREQYQVLVALGPRNET